MFSLPSARLSGPLFLPSPENHPSFLWDRSYNVNHAGSAFNGFAIRATTFAAAR